MTHMAGTSRTGPRLGASHRCCTPPIHLASWAYTAMPETPPSPPAGGAVTSGATMIVSTRPCYYDSGVQCDDCDGRPPTCAALIAQDQTDDDGE